MRVGMGHRFMHMRMAMASRGHHVVSVQMMSVVVPVGMFMLQSFVYVLVPVALSQVQHNSGEHESTTQQHEPSRRALSKAEGHGSTDEGCESEH